MKSAEYTVEPLLIGDRLYIPKKDQKLLVLHFNAHNPQKEEALLRYDDFGMTAVDAKDQNWEYVNDLGVEKTKERADLLLKPAQKMDVYTALLVPAAGEVPKLIVKSIGDEGVLRYDLRGKVKGMSSPFADPKDKTGATALQTIPAQLGVYYPLGFFDFKLESASFSDKPVGDRELEEGSRNLILVCSVKNRSPEEALLRSDTFTCRLVDTEGIEIDWNQDIYAASRDAVISTDVKPGQEIKYRYVCPMPKDVTCKSLSVCEWEGRAFVYDLSGVK